MYKVYIAYKIGRKIYKLYIQCILNNYRIADFFTFQCEEDERNIFPY